MTQNLYDEFSQIIASFSGVDLPDAIDGSEHAINRARQHHAMDVAFPESVAADRPADRILEVFSGHTLGEVVAVWARFRSELADELVRRGTEPDIVHELREGGPRP
jgi:hypothetical protein